MLTQILEGVLTLLATIALITFFPVKTQVYKTTKSQKELAKKFRKFDLFSLVTIFIVTPICCVVFGFLLYGISIVRFFLFSDNTILVTQEWWMWAVFPGLFLAFALLGFIGTPITKKILKDDFPDYMAYSNTKHGYDGHAAMQVIGRILLVLSGIYIILGLDFYTVFSEKEIRWNPFFNLIERTYKYGEIERIAHVQKFVAPNGDIKDRPYYIVVFNDQKIWESNWNGFENEEKNEELILFLSQKTGKEIEVLDILNE